MLLKCMYQARKVNCHACFYLVVSILPLSNVFVITFGNILTMWYCFCFFILMLRSNRELFFPLWRVWKYEWGNHHPYIEEEQAKKMAKQNEQMDKQRSTKHTIISTDRVIRTGLKTWGEPMCSGRIRSSTSSSDTSRVNLVTNPVISAMTKMQKTS